MRKLVALGALTVVLGGCSPSTSVSTSVGASPVVSPTVLHFKEDPSFHDNRVQRIRGLDAGDVVARLTVPRLDLHEYAIRFGVGLSVLAKGPGLYPGSAAPGEGNFAMAGHRITPVGPFRTCSQGADAWGTFDCHGPFRYVNKLKHGDVARVTYKGKVYRYEFERTIIVLPTNVSIIRDGRADMTFTACHPPGSSTHRIVAQWRLVDASPMR